MLTLPAHVLRDLLAGTALAATRDITLPVLHTVHLRWDAAPERGDARDGLLVTTATDRYRMHEGRVQVLVDEPGEALVDLPDVEALVKLLPKAARGSSIGPDATLEVRDGALVVEYAGNVRRLPLVDGTFPKVEALWPSEEKRHAYDVVCFNPRYVADLAKIPLGRKGETYWTWSFTATGRDRDRLGPTLAVPASGNEHPVIVWRCLVMPIRVNPGGAA